MRVCMRACVHACMCACVCVCVHTTVGTSVRVCMQVHVLVMHVPVEENQTRDDERPHVEAVQAGLGEWLKVACQHDIDKLDDKGHQQERRCAANASACVSCALPLFAYCTLHVCARASGPVRMP